MNYKKNILGIIFSALITTLAVLCGFSTDVLAQTVKQNIEITKVYSTVSGNKIKWINSYSADGYEIFRSVNGSTYKKYASTTKKIYEDINIETGEEYSYKIRAYKKQNGKKKYSSKSKKSVTLTAKPTGVSEVNVYYFSNYNQITWEISDLASGYRVYRSEDGNNWDKIADIEINSDIYEDENLESGVNYTYKVSVVEIVDGNIYESVATKGGTGEGNLGIDVSYHNGKINWRKVKNAGITFAMIRLGYGTEKGGVVDSQLDYNYNQAKKYGIKIGFYLYSYADNKKEAKKEAKFTLELLKKYSDIDYPVAYDFENTYRNRKKYKKSNTKIIQTYCNYLEKRGYDTCVYSYVDFLKKSVNYQKVSKYGIWLARWTDSTDSFKSYNIPNVVMWQYSSKGSIKGITGAVDLNLDMLN